MFKFNPKVKDLLDEDTTMLSFAWSCYWRLGLVITLVALVIELIAERL